MRIGGDDESTAKKKHRLVIEYEVPAALSLIWVD
jgi:hypothetical protein